MELTEEPIDLVRVEMLHDTVCEDSIRAARGDHRGLGTRDPVNLVVVVAGQILVDPPTHEVRQVEQGEMVDDVDEVTSQPA